MAELLVMYMDKIEQAGVVMRIYWYGIFGFEDGHREWHYFGTDPVEKPPPDNLSASIVEHAYVQFPEDMNHLPADEVEDALKDLAVKIGPIKEGLIE